MNALLASVCQFSTAHLTSQPEAFSWVENPSFLAIDAIPPN